MAISFTCRTCGKRYKFRDDAAGKRAICKQCGEKIFVPKKTTTDADNFQDAVREESSYASETSTPLPAAVSSGNKRKRKGAGAVRDRSPLRYAVFGAKQGAFYFFVIFVVLELIIGVGAAWSFVNGQPQDNMFIMGIIYVVIGAVFGSVVMLTARLLDSRLAGVLSGAVFMAAEKGIAMAIISGVGFGLQAVGVVLGAVFGFFVSWRMLESGIKTLRHDRD